MVGFDQVCLRFNQILGFFDHRYLWKESIDTFVWNFHFLIFFSFFLFRIYKFRWDPNFKVLKERYWVFNIPLKFFRFCVCAVCAYFFKVCLEKTGSILFTRRSLVLKNLLYWHFSSSVILCLFLRSCALLILHYVILWFCLYC